MMQKIPVSNSNESGFARWWRRLLIALVCLFLTVFLLLPLISVIGEAFALGWRAYGAALADADTRSAVYLTLLIAVVVLPFNIVFGVAAAWALARFNFRGKALVVSLIDLPFAVSPVVAGLMFILLYGLPGLFGKWLAQHGVQIIFAVPGMVLATLFVTFPFVAREIVPLMQAQGSDEEEAALSLGASPWQMFFRITLPNIRWGLIYGMILANARAMGEFGAVSVVSGHIRGQTNTLPLHIEILYNEYNSVGAFAAASLLVVLALITLIGKHWSERHLHAGEARRREER